MKQTTIIKRGAFTIASLFFWLLLWQFLAKRVSLGFVLPTPLTVFAKLWDFLKTGEFYFILLFSFFRISTGFLAAMLTGFLLGTTTHYFVPFRYLFSPMMSVIRATPVASFILVVLFWMEKDWVPSFVSFLMVLPIVWQNTLLGFETRDPALQEMAQVYNLGKAKTFWRIHFPHIIGYVLSAGKTGLGLAWKAGVAAEVLALPKVSVGYMIYNAKMYLETEELYAWTLAIILFSMIPEKLIFSLILRQKGASDANHY